MTVRPPAPQAPDASPRTFTASTDASPASTASSTLRQPPASCGSRSAARAAPSSGCSLPEAANDRTALAPDDRPGGPASGPVAFLVPLAREQVPVWVYPPDGLRHAHAGLVLRANASDLQIFTRPGLDWDGRLLQLHVLDLRELPDAAPDAAPGQQPGLCATWVRRRWRRTVSHSGDLHGLSFLDPDCPVARRLSQAQPDPAARRWVRCMIEPGSVAQAPA